MSYSPIAPVSARVRLASQILTGLALVVVLAAHLAAALLAGLLVYALVGSLAPGRCAVRARDEQDAGHRRNEQS